MSEKNIILPATMDGSLPGANTEDPMGMTVETESALRASVKELEKITLQMGRLVMNMQERMDELEAKQAAVTIDHKAVLRMNGMIRSRAAELNRKYKLKDGGEAAIRAAIKKDLKKRYGIRDLHDLQERTLPGAETMITTWTSIRMMMDWRAQG